MVPLSKHATISAPAGDTLADKERKQRVHIADEITNTEREYYKDLDFTIIVSSSLLYFLFCLSNSFVFFYLISFSFLLFLYFISIDIVFSYSIEGAVIGDGVA